MLSALPPPQVRRPSPEAQRGRATSARAEEAVLPGIWLGHVGLEVALLFSHSPSLRAGMLDFPALGSI